MSDDCRRLIELLSDLVDGELPPEELANLHRHLEKCAPCGVYVSTFRLTVTMSRRLPPATMPCEMEERIKRVLQREFGGPG